LLNLGGQDLLRACFAGCSSLSGGPKARELDAGRHLQVLDGQTDLAVVRAEEVVPALECLDGGLPEERRRGGRRRERVLPAEPNGEREEAV
jgi:hypothetical protein